MNSSQKINSNKKFFLILVLFTSLAILLIKQVLDKLKKALFKMIDIFNNLKQKIDWKKQKEGQRANMNVVSIQETINQLKKNKKQQESCFKQLKIEHYSIDKNLSKLLRILIGPSGIRKISLIKNLFLLSKSIFQRIAEQNEQNMLQNMIESECLSLNKNSFQKYLNYEQVFAMQVIFIKCISTFILIITSLNTKRMFLIHSKYFNFDFNKKNTYQQKLEIDNNNHSQAGLVPHQQTIFCEQKDRENQFENCQFKELLLSTQIQMIEPNE